jgi:transposase
VSESRSSRGAPSSLGTTIFAPRPWICDQRPEREACSYPLQVLPGIGPVLAAVIVAEIGDVRRFASAASLCCWAGLTPRHRESDAKVTRGHITKQGSRVLRWAVVEAIQHQPAGSPVRAVKDRIIARRGKEAKNIAKTAAARRLLTAVFYTMRDGQARSQAAA